MNIGGIFSSPLQPQLEQGVVLVCWAYGTLGALPEISKAPLCPQGGIYEIFVLQNCAVIKKMPVIRECIFFTNRVTLEGCPFGFTGSRSNGGDGTCGQG
jgi:hypothetical protein